MSAELSVNSRRHNAIDRVKKEAGERKRAILLLILDYLNQNRLFETAETLEREAQLPEDFEVCDNVDLDTMLQEYQSYYFTKFNKPPKITKRCNPPREDANKKVKKRVVNRTPNSSSPAIQEDCPPETSAVGDFCFEVTKLLPHTRQPKSEVALPNRADAAYESVARVVPLCEFDGYSQEWREMADQILKSIVPSSLGVTWKDCVGLDAAVELLKEAVVYPLTYPELFKGLTSAWKGILLYGPPGTGKTLLSKAVACETNTTFFNLTSSSFVTKWRGESEKMIKVLFDVAQLYAPSTIFIDELDALASSSGSFNHEASRRFKSELLVQLDGILREDDRIFVLATTNRPWDLDSAILRRFDKRILVGLPREAARTEIFKHYLSRISLSDEDFKELALVTESFSGSDIKNVCKEACMRKLRELIKSGEITKVEVEEPRMVDLFSSIEKVHPVTTSGGLEKYRKWYEMFGCL